MICPSLVIDISAKGQHMPNAQDSVVLESWPGPEHSTLDKGYTICKLKTDCGKSASLQCNSRHISKTYVIPDIFHIPYSCLQVRKHYPPECKYMRSLMKSTARTTCHEVTSAWLCTWVPWWQRCEWHLCLCQRETCQPTRGSRHRTNKSGRNKERELI